MRIRAVTFVIFRLQIAQVVCALGVGPLAIAPVGRQAVLAYGERRPVRRVRAALMWAAANVTLSRYPATRFMSCGSGTPVAGLKGRPPTRVANIHGGPFGRP